MAEPHVVTALIKKRAEIAGQITLVNPAATVGKISVLPREASAGFGATGKGWWRMALSYQATEGMTLAWIRQQGLVPVTDRYFALQTEGNRRGT